MNRKYKQTEIGKLPENWEIKQLKDVAVVNEENIDTTYKYDPIEYIDISSVDQGTIFETKPISRTDAPSRAQRIVRENDILLSTVRPNLKHYAFVRRAQPNAIASTGFAVITAKQINPRFLYYYLTTDKYTDYLSAIADTHTSTYPACNPDVIEDSFISYPPIDEQRAISKILSDLDEKIELNQQMNKTLESIAQAIFKHWFIDFEFPDENGKLYKSSGGKMVESELGKVPKEWTIGAVSKSFNLAMGQSPPGETYNEIGEGITFFQGRADFGFRFPVERVYCTAPTRYANPGDTLVTVRAPVGDVNMALQKCCIGRGLASIRHKSGSRSYTYYAMQTLRQTFDNYEAEGTVFGSIGKDDFNAITVVIPPPSIIQEFEKRMTPIDQLIEENVKNARLLVSIRDSLLPKLMSGKIRIGAN